MAFPLSTCLPVQSLNKAGFGFKTAPSNLPVSLLLPPPLVAIQPPGKSLQNLAFIKYPLHLRDIWPFLCH